MEFEKFSLRVEYIMNQIIYNIIKIKPVLTREGQSQAECW
jgi:hypothetical protein